MNTVLNFIGIVALSIGLTLLNLLILTKIYALTVATSFGLPPIGIMQMFGLGWFVSSLTLKVTDSDLESKKTSTKSALIRSAVTTITLLASWGLAALVF